jgi:amino acid adenylation domain-containing protein
MTDLLDPKEATTGALGVQPDEGFVELFVRQVAAAPDAAAVVCPSGVVTFAELNGWANRLAWQLRGLGVGAEAPVGVLVERSPGLVAGVLGVLKAGGAFVGLDAGWPAERLRFVLADCGAGVVVTTRGLASLVDGLGVRAVFVDEVGGPEEELPDVPALSAAAYVCYTSGSTGTPKGVVVSHRSLVVFASEVAARLQLGAGDRFLQFASAGFDVLVEELFPVWLAGGAVVVPPAGPVVDVWGVAAAERVTVVELPAALWHQLVVGLERGGVVLPESLRLVIVGAERVLPQRVASWVKTRVPLMHVYGVTEATVSSTFYRLPARPSDADVNHLPIGSPLPSVRLRVLDPDLQPVPSGGVGELYIGGVGVARGYWGRPGLTAERFVADPFVPGQRLYRSGDLVRQRADGNLEFVCRADDQINIRGLRVEPAEIESAICRHPQVSHAVVTVWQPSAEDRRLVAYVVAAPRTRPNVTDLRRFLARSLPPYLVPSAFVQIEAVPLTVNGKVDFARLPEPGDQRPDLAEEFVAARTPLERQLAGIVADVLGVTTVGVTDNFFDLGGDSILAIQVVARAQEQGIGLSPLDLFEHPTVAQLAEAASTAAGQETAEPEPEPEPAAGGESGAAEFPLARVDQDQIDTLLRRIATDEAS